MLHILLADFRIGRHKRLMRRQSAKIQPLPERPLLNALQHRGGLVFHLHVQNFDRVKTGIGG